MRELAAEAEDVARAAALSLPFPEASWLIGFDRSFTEQLGKRGWIGMTWPIEDGGHGRTALERFVVYEQLIRHGAPICAGYFADRQMGPSLLQFGTPAQRKRWLPGIVAGTSMWCIGMSEPDAGSDVGSARTRADRDGDDWIVNGNKVWTSGAAHADWCYCVVRTDSSAAKHAGLSDLVIDMRSPGISVHPIKDMTASEHFCEVNFTDVRVPGSNLVGKENSSFRQLMRQLEHERGGIDRLLSNYALYTAVRSMIDPATTRDPVVRQELAHIEAGYRIGRNLVLREVLQQAPHGFSAATKLFCTELEVQIANVVARLLGPAAMLWGPDSGLGGRAAREVCYAPSYRIMGGTAEILRNIIGERVLGLPR
ncbi:MAG: putative acyl-CoA dehydrogenase [Acidimicrobiales bacterium]|nr:putative acyl-CoA dehydrogenase [Acidimicrobiales bacterium]